MCVFVLVIQSAYVAVLGLLKCRICNFLRINWLCDPRSCNLFEDGAKKQSGVITDSRRIQACREIEKSCRLPYPILGPRSNLTAQHVCRSDPASLYSYDMQSWQNFVNTLTFGAHKVTTAIFAVLQTVGLVQCGDLYNDWAFIILSMTVTRPRDQMLSESVTFTVCGRNVVVLWKDCRTINAGCKFYWQFHIQQI